MAEFADVRLALAGVILAAAYPNGTGEPSAIAGLTGVCAIFQNDPIPADIDARTAAGDVLVAVVEMGDGRPTKRYPVVDQVVSTPAATLGWTVAGDQATLTGTPSTPQNLALIIDGVDFIYQVQPGDTLDGIAADLAAEIAAVREASASGPTITIPGSHLIIARVGVVSTTLRETGRQRARLRVTIWAGTEALRAATARVIRPALDDLRRLALPEGTVAWVGCGAEMPVYAPLKLGLARTNLVHEVEFPSTLPGTAAQAIVWRITVQGAAAAFADFTETEPPPITIED